jgi:hypothetical protein
LVFGINAQQLVRDLTIYSGDCLEHPLAKIALLIAIAQFHRLVGTRRCARGHGGTAKTAIFEQHIDFDSGVATAVENFAAVDVNDRGHCGYIS